MAMALAPLSLPPQLPPYNLVASLRSVTAHAAAPAEASSSTYAGPSVWMMKVDGPPHWHTQSDSVCTCDAMRTMTNASGHAHCSHPLWGGDMRHRPDMIAARGKRLLPLGYGNKHNNSAGCPNISICSRRLMAHLVHLQLLAVQKHEAATVSGYQHKHFDS